MYAAREDIREVLTLQIQPLSTATRYTVGCATSTVLPTLDEFSKDDSSLIIPTVPPYKSTRGDTEAIKGVYPSFVVAKQRTLVHLTTTIIGDNFYKMVGFTRKLCDPEHIVSPTYLQYQRSTVWVLFEMKDIGVLMMCYSGDGGETFWLQDSPDAVLDVTATSRHAITAVVPSWSVLGERTVFELHGRGGDVVGDGWSKKIGLSRNGCLNVVMDEYIQSEKNTIIFILQTFETFDICYSEDYGQYWTLQIAHHLGITGYATSLGASNAQLKYVKFIGADLDRPFHPDIQTYRGSIGHEVKDIQLQGEPFEPRSSIQILVDDEVVFFENGRKVPIHATHITDRTLIEARVTAPDRINQQSYFITIQRTATWDENAIQEIRPQQVISSFETLWTLYPLVHGDGDLVRIAFVIDDERSDCRLPQISLPVDMNSQVTGSVLWNYYGLGQFRVCYSTTGGKMWHKQKSPNAVIFVDGSRERMPWHLATFIWMLLCLLLRVYCVRLRVLSKNEEVKEMMLEKELAARGKVKFADKVTDKVIWMKDMMVIGSLWCFQKVIERCCGKESASASRKNEEDDGFYHGAMDYEKYKNIDVFAHSDSDSGHSLEEENSEEMRLR